MKTNLLKWGTFKSHSGVTLPFKIDCDALTDEDISCIAKWFDKTHGHFKKVVGIPTGGLRLVKELEKYVDHNAKDIMIVDDVFTTGRSMEEKKQELIKKGEKKDFIFGFVIFARKPEDEIPAWIDAMFYRG